MHDILVKNMPDDNSKFPIDIESRISAKIATISIIGLGYVGLPLAMSIGRAGFKVIGYDTDCEKIESLADGVSYIPSVTSDDVVRQLETKLFSPTCDFDMAASCDVIIICVPTPLTQHRDPDTSYVERACRSIAGALRPGQLVVLESTSYPGTTEELVKPILEKSGLQSASDFYLGFSPEREDPGNCEYATSSIPKIIAGDGLQARRLIERLYEQVFEKVVPVSSIKIAEAAKLTENIFRAVNIGLANELKTVFDAMKLNIWEIIAAASTKPFGYMPFYPGPGLGGHCIPVDPIYLVWKAREFDVRARLVELAADINSGMPQYVVEKLNEALEAIAGAPIKGATILLVGLSYKRNVPDVRESPAVKILNILEKRGGNVAYYDPMANVNGLAGERNWKKMPPSISRDDLLTKKFDAAIVITDHDNIDYSAIALSAKVIIDTRNAYGSRGIFGPNIFTA